MDARSERIAKAFELPIIVAALLVIPVIVVEESEFREPWTVAIVILTPPFLPASLQAARLLRVFRLLRLLPFVRVARRVFSVEGLRLAALLALLTALGGGAAFAAAEEGTGTWDGVYWAVSTMTTVGYGDITPTTDTGRVIAMCVMVVGIGFLTMVIGAVSERFIVVELREEVEEAEEEVEADLEAARAELAGELRAIMARLGELEATVQRLGRGRGVGSA